MKLMTSVPRNPSCAIADRRSIRVGRKHLKYSDFVTHRLFDFCLRDLV